MTLEARAIRPATFGETRRPGRIYGFTTLHDGPWTDGFDGLWRPVCGYVGKTRQTLQARSDQHAGLEPNPDGSVYQQPWWDVKVGDVWLIEEGWWTDAELDARERYWIGAYLPVFNERDNRLNPHRVPIFTAQEQRQARDEANGVPTGLRWQPRGEAVPVMNRPTRHLRTVRLAWRRLPRRWRRRGLQVAAWTGLSLAVFVAFMMSGVTVGTVGAGPLSAAVGAAPFAAWHLSTPRQRRRAGLALVGLVGLVVAAWLLTRVTAGV